MSTSSLDMSSNIENETNKCDLDEEKPQDLDEELIESKIINGIISDNVKYFKENYVEGCYLHKRYFNDYINGNFCEKEHVFSLILEEIDEKLLGVIINSTEKYGLFVKDFIDYIILNKKITEFEKILSFGSFLNTITEDRLEYLFFKLVSKFEYKEVKTIFFIVLKNKQSRSYILDWFSKKIEEFKYHKNIRSLIDLEFDYVDYIEAENKIIMNITLIILDIWDNGIKLDKLLKINREGEKFLSNGFFKIHECLDVGFVNMLQELKFRIKEKQEYDRIQATAEGSINMGIIMINHKLEKRIEYLKSVLSNEEYISKIGEFYKKTILWFNHTMFNEDDILCSMGIYYKNTTKGEDLSESNFYKLILNVLKDSKLTKNPNIKVDYLEILNFKCIWYKEFNDENYLEFNKDISNIVNILPNLFEYIKKSYHNEEIYDLMYASTMITNIINSTLFKDTGYKFYFDKTKEENSKNIKKLIYDNITNLQNCYDEILKRMKLIKEEEDDDGGGNTRKINRLKEQIREYNYTLTIISEFLEYVSKDYYDLILSDEIKDAFSNVFIDILNKYTYPVKENYEILNSSKMLYSHQTICLFVVNICINITYDPKSYDKFIKLIKKNDTYSHDLLIKILDDNHLDVDNLQYYLIKDINSKINLLEIVEDIDEDVEVPDELCDPIMSTLIEKPIMLPNNIIMDYAVITRHLLNNDNNPFNRDKLDIQILDEYNKKPDVIEKIDEFKKKLDEFKKTLKK